MFSLQAWDFCTWVERYNNLYKLRLKQLEGAVSGVKFCFDLAVLRRKDQKRLETKLNLIHSLPNLPFRKQPTNASNHHEVRLGKRPPDDGVRYQRVVWMAQQQWGWQQ